MRRDRLRLFTASGLASRWRRSHHGSLTKIDEDVVQLSSDLCDRNPEVNAEAARRQGGINAIDRPVLGPAMNSPNYIYTQSDQVETTRSSSRLLLDLHLSSCRAMGRLAEPETEDAGSVCQWLRLRLGIVWRLS